MGHAWGRKFSRAALCRAGVAAGKGACRRGSILAARCTRAGGAAHLEASG